MLDIIIEFFVRFIAIVLLWLILFPVVMILATPVILAVSACGTNNRYSDRVANGYDSVYDFWRDWGYWCLPF